MLSTATLLASSFVFVFLKAFQQRNVAFGNLPAIVPVSLLMACVEVYIVVNVAARGFTAPVVVATGLGSGLGALAAVLVHRKLFKGALK